MYCLDDVSENTVYWRHQRQSKRRKQVHAKLIEPTENRDEHQHFILVSHYVYAYNFQYSERSSKYDTHKKTKNPFEKSFLTQIHRH